MNQDMISTLTVIIILLLLFQFCDAKFDHFFSYDSINYLFGANTVDLFHNTRASEFAWKMLNVLHVGTDSDVYIFDNHQNMFR